MSAVLVPFAPSGQIDWEAFGRHVARTSGVGIVPAINMDTGYVQLLDNADRLRALTVAREVLGPTGEMVAGACVVDRPGDPFNRQAYGEQVEMSAAAGALPVIFPSFGLTAGGDAETIARLAELGRQAGRFIGFELSTEFVPCGRIFSLAAYEQLLQIEQCIGAKHSSLSRRAEWERLAVRDRVRPDFAVFTGNDLAIDMVRYGSDWLLGLSTAVPEAFAQRDAWWAAGDGRFDELDDALQALGDFAFRRPVPAYNHPMAQALFLRGLIATDEPHPESPRRPASDREIVATILGRIDQAQHA